MNILVAGASGFAGTALLHGLADKGHHVVGTYHRNIQPGLVHMDLQVTNEMSSLFKKYPFDWVIDLAFEHDNVFCNSNPKKSRRINVDGTAKLAEITARFNIGKFIFFSSEYVYQGCTDEMTITENSPLSDHPTTYARHKIEAEQQLRKIFSDPSRLLTIRPSIMFGYNGKGLPNGFWNHILETPCRMRTELRKPLWIGDAVDGVISLLEKNASGDFNLAGPDIISNFQLGQRLRQLVYEHGIVNDDKVEELPADSIIRPKVFLDTRKAEQLGVRFTPLKEILPIIETQLKKETSQLCERFGRSKES